MSFQGLVQRFYWVALTHPVFRQKYFIFMRIIVKELETAWLSLPGDYRVTDVALLAETT